MGANYELSGENFINPYNFVPVDKGKVKRKDIKEKYEENKEELLYGKIECQMICKTPLAIPDTALKEQEKGVSEEHYYYPFMSVGGHYIVPGSSIRGVVRNVYETITNSCYATMKKDTKISIRSANPFANAGLLFCENGVWKLYKAQKHLINQEEFSFELQDYRDMVGKEFEFRRRQTRNSSIVIWFKPKSGQKTSVLRNQQTMTGYLAIGESFSKKNHDALFQKSNPQNYPEQTIKSALRDLEEILKIYRDDKINLHYPDEHGGYKWFEAVKKDAEAGNGAIPIYFQDVQGRLYVSPAQIGRKFFQRTLNNIVGNLAPEKCDKRSNLCPACSLFGTVKSDKALGSRLRFTDANLLDEAPKATTVVFAELSSPKPSYLPFYLKKNNGVDLIDGYDGTAVDIRGRKFYWHHTPVPQNPTNMPERNKRNATLDTLPSGTKFKFDVYFDGITKEQLSQLCTAINLNENDGETLCHKIGHGKPLGYGSVKIKINEIKTRTFDKEHGWKEAKIDVPQNDNFFCGNETQNALLTICKFDTCKDRVCYPYVEPFGNKSTKSNEDASHQWFSTNYKLGNNSPKYFLPNITDDSPALPSAVKLGGNSSHGNHSSDNNRNNGYNNRQFKEKPRVQNFDKQKQQQPQQNNPQPAKQTPSTNQKPVNNQKPKQQNKNFAQISTFNNNAMMQALHSAQVNKDKKKHK